MVDPILLPRIAQFRDYGFGMFIHWGLYSQLGIGEWAWNYHKDIRETYTDLQKDFHRCRL